MTSDHLSYVILFTKLERKCYYDDSVVHMEIVLFIHLHFRTIIEKVSKSVQPYKNQREREREKKVKEKIGDTQRIYVYPQGKVSKIILHLIKQLGV